MAKRKEKASGKKKSGGFSFARIFFERRTFLAGLFVALLLTGLGVVGLKAFFLAGDFFMVKEVVMLGKVVYLGDEPVDKVKKLYIGSNIFSVDLKGAAAMISRAFPSLKYVEVNRAFPDRIELNVVEREPIVFINAGDGMVVDNEGYVIGVGVSRPELIELKVVVAGFPRKPALGTRISRDYLRNGLMLYSMLKQCGIMEKAKFNYIDVSDKQNIALGVNGVMVKIGNEAFAEKINRLKEMMGDPKVKFEVIKYIDLRFDDTVISPK